MALHTALCICPNLICLPPPSPSFPPFAITEYGCAKGLIKTVGLSDTFFPKGTL